MRNERSSGLGRGLASSSTSRSTGASSVEPWRTSESFSAPPPAIGQAELEAYRALKDQLDRLKERFQEQRLDLIRRLTDGAPVQPGRLRAVIRDSQQRQLTSTKLAEILGVDEVERLKNLVAPTIQTELRVTE
jgi:hypothetical protein